MLYLLLLSLGLSFVAPALSLTFPNSTGTNLTTVKHVTIFSTRIATNVVTKFMTSGNASLVVNQTSASSSTTASSASITPFSADPVAIASFEQYMSRNYPFSMDSSLTSICMAQQISNYEAYLQQQSTIGNITVVSIWNDTDCPDCSLLGLYGTHTVLPSTYHTTGSHTFVYTENGRTQYNPTYSPPCCGTCTIEIGNARVFYWPTPNPQPNVTEIVNSEGYTFTYPSPYVRFQYGGAVNSCGKVGRDLNVTTIGFTEGALSTWRFATNEDARVGIWSLNFKDWNSCSSFFNSTTNGLTRWPPATTTQDGIAAVWEPCEAQLALPSQIRDVRPEWASCLYQGSGVWDPPLALTKAPGGLLSVTSAGPMITVSAVPKNISPPTGPVQAPSPTHTTAMSLPNLGSKLSYMDPSAPLESTPAAKPASLDPGSIEDALTATKHASSSVSFDPQASNHIAPGLDSQIPRVPQPQSGVQSPATPLAASTSPSTIVIIGQSAGVPTEGASNVALDSGTLSLNGPGVTISDTLISLGSNGLLVGTSTVALAHPSPQASASPNIVGGMIASSVPPAVVVGSQTVIGGQPAITISGTPVFIGSAGLVVASSTFPLSQAATSQVMIGGQTASVAPSAIVFGTQTVTRGQSAVTISGTPVSLGPAGLVIAGNTVALAPTQAQPIATVAGQAVTFAGPSSLLAIGHATLTAGAPPITISGTPVSLGSAGLVVGGSTMPLSPTRTQAIATIAAQIVTSGALPGFLAIGSTTLTPGAPAITISGTPVSLGSTGLVIGGSTIPLQSPQPYTTVAGLPITSAGPGLLAIGSTTLTLGASAITISGTPVSLGSAALVVAGSTIPLPPAQKQAVATIAGQIITSAGPGLFAIGSATLTPGAPAITISGTPISLAASGVLVIGSSTLTPSLSFTIGSETFAADAGHVVVGGHTLTPGSPAVTVDGTVVSLGSSELVVGDKTEMFAPEGTTAGGLGALIVGGLGGSGGVSATATATGVVGATFLGAAERSGGSLGWLGAVGLVVGAGLGLGGCG